MSLWSGNISSGRVKFPPGFFFLGLEVCYCMVRREQAYCDVVFPFQGIKGSKRVKVADPLTGERDK